MVASRCRFAQRLRHAGTTLALRRCHVCQRWRHGGFEMQICATFAPRWHNISRFCANKFKRAIFACGVFDWYAHLRHVGAALAQRWRRVGTIFITLAPRWLRTSAPRWLRDTHLRHVGATLAQRWRLGGAKFAGANSRKSNFVFWHTALFWTLFLDSRKSIFF